MALKCYFADRATALSHQFLIVSRL